MNPILQKLYDKANQETPSNPYRWASSSCGRLEVVILYRDACKGSHSGRCEDDIDGLRQIKYIKMQLESFDKTVVSEVMQEYFVDSDYDPECLDYENNLSRLLWIFCGDILDYESEREVL